MILTWTGNMTSFLFKIFILAVVQVSICMTYAYASPQIITKMDPKEGDIDTTFIYEIRVIVDDKSSISTPTFEKSEFFDITPYSTSMQQHRVNNQIRLQRIFSFKLNPLSRLSAGTYATPEGSTYVGNREFKIPPETISIVDTTNLQSNRLFQGQNGAKIPKDIDEFSFVQLVSNEKPFIGEQVSYRLELITPTNLKEAKLQEFNPQGVWRERFENDGKSSRMVQNVTIHSFSEALFPIQSGIIELPRRELLAHLVEHNRRRRPQGNNLSEQFFSGLFPFFDDQRIVERTISSNSLQLQVRPLPSPPSGHSGYTPVGKTRFTTTVDKDSSEVGESVLLTIQIVSTGNLKPYTLPKPDVIDSTFRLYEDKPIFSRTTNQGEVIFYKTFRISLVPQKAGTYKIPEYTIYWFDPATENYKHAKTASKTILVKDNLQSQHTLLDENANIDLNQKAEDNRKENEIKNLESYRKSTRYVPNYVLWPLVFFAIIKSIFVLFYISFLKKKEKKHDAKMNQQKAKEILGSLKMDSSTNSTISFIHAENLLKEYLSTCYSHNFHSLTAQEIVNTLKNEGLRNETISKINNFLTSSENMRYSGSDEKEIPSNEMLTILKMISGK